ncbi:polysaccharide deacetylase family protein [Wenzhouxiangella sp. EGI_FJ10409]|uniref:polysaccharide deacetylase family protein n=1 Tax=Wenzhouxiangella sp. EGI_FJ10409 TaxID=3243767 RepID=UPI0035DE3821
MKETLRAVISRAMVASGATALGRAWGNHDGAVILYGHRVSDDDEGYMQGLPPHCLDEQLAYLCRHYEIISLDTLVSCLESGQRVPEKSIVLTFDDGFRDNYENAFPRLQKHRAPATIFLVTGSIDTGQLPWSQRLGFLFQHTQARWFRHELLSEELPLSSICERRQAYMAIKAHVRHMGQTQRERVLARVSKDLAVDPPMDRMMTWEHAREMQAAGIEMGAHTVSHSLLANIDPDDARREMAQSRDAITEKLDVKHPKFCFPAGSWNHSLVETARQLGMRSLFIPARSRVINQIGAVDPFSMGRMGIPNAPAYILEAELDGPLHKIRRLYRH